MSLPRVYQITPTIEKDLAIDFKRIRDRLIVRNFSESM